MRIVRIAVDFAEGGAAGAGPASRALAMEKRIQNLDHFIVVTFFLRRFLPTITFARELFAPNSGFYGVKIESFRDINNNGKTNTSWLGLPLESFGFWRDARPLLSWPGFGGQKAVFAVRALRVKHDRS
jgi:hypothetical protein